MRVPTYQSQTELTGKISAQPFSVRADPGAASQTARAFSGLAGEVKKQGTDFYQRLLTEQRDTELKQAQMDYKQELGSLKLASLSASPSVITGDGPKGFQALAAKLQTKINNGLTDSVVQKRFKLAAADATTNAYITVKQQARNRQIDAAAATKLRYAETLEKQAVYGNATERNEALNELFGPVNKKTGVRDGFSFYARMAGGGLITQSGALKYEQKSRQTIDRYDIEAAIISADDTQSTVTAQRLIDRLEDSNQFTGLDPLTRLAYQQKAVNLQQAIESKQLSDSEARERNSAADATLARKTEERRLGAIILDAQAALVQNQTASSGNQQAVNLVTTNKVNEALSNGKIGLEFAKYANDIITNQDAPADVPAVVTGFTDEIIEANTDKQLEDIRTKILKSGGRTGTVTLNTQESLLGFLEQQQSGTTEARDYKFYSRQLNEQTAKVDSNGFMNLLSMNDNQVERHLDAKLTFYKLTNAPANPMAPEAAFNQIVDQFKKSQQLKIPFLFSNPTIGRLFGYSNTQSRAQFFSGLTNEKIIEASQKIKKDNSISQIEKSFEQETVNLLADEFRRFTLELKDK